MKARVRPVVFLVVALATTVGTPLASHLAALEQAPRSCEPLETAVRADSTELRAAASLGQCAVQDYVMIAPGGDSTRLAFRTSWSTALRALRSAVRQDPTFTAAYRSLFFILFAETRDGCSTVTRECLHVSPVLRDADSVITLPRQVRFRDRGPEPYETAIGETRATWQPSLLEARSTAERWAAAMPNDARPHEYLGQALLRLGEFEAAASEFEQGASRRTAESRRSLFWEHFEALVKSNRGADARRLLDEVAEDKDTSRDVTALALSQLNMIVGRDRAMLVDSARMQRNRARMDSIIRSRPPAPPPPPGFSELLATGDTAAARRSLVHQDSMSRAPFGQTRFPRFMTSDFFRVESYLALGDTAEAETRLAALDEPFTQGRFRLGLLLAYDRVPWLGRAWVLMGDLAAARGRRDDAARFYRRVIGLWGGGDAAVQPVVERARTQLESLQRP